VNKVGSASIFPSIITRRFWLALGVQGSPSALHSAISQAQLGREVQRLYMALGKGVVLRKSII
jgi:hypothetical protein